MSKYGILRAHFDAFSSKNGYETTFTNDYEQGRFIVFECCSFTGKERDSETGFGYFGARYMDYELMTMWLSVDPMADKYPGISPYAYCAWNPVRLVDPDGNEVFENVDIVIKGRNNTSLTIKTDAINLTLHSNRDFGGQRVIDASSLNIAIGYEVGLNASASAVLGSSGNGYMQSVMFLGGKYSGYWYDYLGGEAQMNVSNTAEGTVGTHKNWFITFYSGSKNNFTPKLFAGMYKGFDAGISGNFLLAGVSIDFSWAKSVSSDPKIEQGKWTTFAIGTSYSIGPQIDVISGMVGGYLGGHLGGTTLITPEKETVQRSVVDRLSNILFHLF